MFPTVLQWAKMQTSFGSLCAPTVLLLGCVLVYGYGYAAKDRLLIFSWANQQILERTLTSPMIPKQSEAARLQRLQTWICLCNTTHLAKCCQESFNYLNSKINCCGCRAKSSTVLLLAFQILWKISLWTGILPQADRAQHGFTELTVYWDIVSKCK